MWIYILSAEIISVLKAFGTILQISDGILGVTAFAFGNSIGDFVNDIALAKMGFYMMATGACWGAPTLSTIIFTTQHLQIYYSPSVSPPSFSHFLWGINRVDLHWIILS